MATKYVTLKDSNGDTLYPQAVATNLAPGSIKGDEIDVASLTASYSISDTPAHSGGTKYYQLKKVLNIVALNIRDIWANSVTAQTWLTLGTIPSAVRPNDEVKAVAAVYAGATGNLIDYAHASVKADGTVRVKTTSSYGGLVGFCFSITWVIS